MKLLHLFILLIFSTAFIGGQLLRFEFLNGIAITGLDIAIFFIAVTTIIFYLKDRDIAKTKLLKPIFLFFIVCSLSLVINIPSLPINSFLSSFLYALRWIMYSCLYFYISKLDSTNKKNVLKYLIFMGSMIVGIGYIQYFFYPNLRNLYYLGWDDHLYRMFSTFLDPNFAAAFFVLFLLLLISTIQEKLIYGYKKEIIGYSILSLLTLIAVFLTFSRSGLLMLLAGFIIYFLIQNKKKFIVMGSITIVVLLLIFSNYGIEGTNPFRTASSKARIDSLQNATKIFIDHPLLGIGFNAYRYAQNRYGFRTSSQWQTSHADAGTDNSILFVLATTGIIGLSIYMYLWFSAIKMILQKKSKHFYFSLCILASIGALFVDSIYINSLFYTSIMAWMWIVLGLMENT